MKLLSFVREGQASWGGVVGQGLVDIGARCAGQFPDLKSFISAGMPGDVLEDLGPAEIDLTEVVACTGDPESRLKLSWRRSIIGKTIPIQARLRPIRCCSCGCRHRRSAMALPLIEPRSSEKLDFEGELAVIIGTGGRHISRDQAMDHVAGYACYNDASVRDWQKHSHQFTPGKNFVGTGAFGPWMVQADDLPIQNDGVALVTRVNGVEKQRTTIDRMIFDIPYLISYISTFAPLEPGDVIVTGTCTGFGITRDPKEFLRPGDVVEVEIEGIGVLSNKVEAEA